MRQMWKNILKLNKVYMFLFVFGLIMSISNVSVFATSMENTLVSGEIETATVSISGTVEVGQILTADVKDADATATIVYQWMRGSTDIDGATGNTYTITSDDAGSTLQVTVLITVADTTTSLSATTSVVPEVDPDINSVNVAKNQVESAVFLDPTKESDYADEAAIIAYATKLATASVEDSSVSITVQTVNYIPATNGTIDNTTGTSGSYEFTVKVAKGVQSATTVSHSFVIPAVAYVPTTYEMISGAGQQIDMGSEVTLTFASNGEVANFQGLYCNGVLVSTDNYSIAEDTVSVTLHASYVKALAAGIQEFTLVFADGSVSADVVVVDAEEDQSTTAPESDSTESDTPESDTSDLDEVITEEEDEVEVEEEEEELQDDEVEFEPADEPEEELVVEPDDVNTNILWVVLVLIVVLIIAEVFIVRRKRRPGVTYEDTDEVGELDEAEVDVDEIEELDDDAFGDETGFEDMDAIEEIDD